MVNLECKEASLKATWPLILKQEEDYARMVYGNLKCKMLEEDIWRCNLQEKDVVHMKIKETFWLQVLESWSEYNYNNNIRVENQLLWYNSLIRVKNKPIFWGDMFQKGLKFVHQLFKDGEFITFEEANEVYGLSKLRFNSLKVSIPQNWKDFFYQKRESIIFTPTPPHNYDKFIITNGRGMSQEIYRVLQEDILLIHSKYIKWRLEIPGDWSFGTALIDFGNLHKSIYKITNVAKYRSFQNRVLQRALVTNIQLKYWGLVESDACTNCGKEKETTSHLLAKCEVVNPLWEKVKRFWTIYITF